MTQPDGGDGGYGDGDRVDGDRVGGGGGYGGDGGDFLLFDDQHVRRVGNWGAVKRECVKAHYQPVLLLYELEST
ncbi:hypothetical protein B484DRAFT_453237 [Ochromonadaceae sp. CCMP2298]|nr:hypothetical protein B484DRAFT_453237 [Ochromonadaceae sp. CCMP2298]